MKRWLTRGLLLAAMFLQNPASAAGQIFESGKDYVSLVELYTSEGCSSCPPADRWLSALKRSPALWKSIVPVAFHVDYWNDLGWQDRYSSAAWSGRQRAHQAAGDIARVYTPGFVVDGAEWRGFFQGAALDLARREPPGNLTLVIDGNAATVTFDGAQDQSLQASLVCLGAGITTRVRAGENDGRTLHHDFVVLSLDTAGSVSGTWHFTLDPDSHPDAVAAWVSPTSGMRAIQSVGGWVAAQ